jgi:hypothetical protein
MRSCFFTRRILLAATVVVAMAEASAAAEEIPDERKARLAAEESLHLAPFAVNARRLTPAEAAELERVEHYDAQYIRDTGAYTIEELLQRLPKGPDGSPVVMIDGRQTSVDIRALPLHLLERVEFNPVGRTRDGRRSPSGVLNLVLKQNYVGREGTVRHQVPLAGGGSQTLYTASVAYNSGKFRAALSLQVDRKSQLTADRRAFAAQDHTAWGGTDFRLPWDALPTIESLSGPLGGLASPDGSPVYTAFVQPGNAAIAPRDLLAGPGGVRTAYGLRRFASERYVPLQGDELNSGSFLMLNYQATEKLELSMMVSAAQNRNERVGPPPVTDASELTRVPAHLNPFGQDVAIGMVHGDFGETGTMAKQTDVRGEFSASYRAGTSSFSPRLRFEHNSATSHARELDPQKFRDALEGPDASRFLPFGGGAAREHNREVYQQVASDRTSRSTGTQMAAALSGQGQAGKTWAGPISWNIEGETTVGRHDTESHGLMGADSSRQQTENGRATASLQLPVLNFQDERITQLRLNSIWTREEATTETEGALFGSSTEDLGVGTRTLTANLAVPLVSGEGRRGLRRLEVEAGGGRVVRSDSAPGEVAEAAIMWAPARSVSFHARLWNNQVAMPMASLPDRVAYNQSAIDPRRGRALTSGIQLVMRRPGVIEPTTVETVHLSLDYEPGWLKGFKFTARYSGQTQSGMVRVLSLQDMLYNESLFASRVTRAAPTAADIALGQPGAVEAVDTSALNTGMFRHAALDLLVEYQREQSALGRFSLQAHHRILLRDETELVPGVPLVLGDGMAAADWTSTFSATWARGQWNSSLRGQFNSAYRHANLPVSAHATIDWRIDYRFPKPLIREFGKDLRVGVGLANLFDADPPRVDVLTGFLGSPHGRVLELTLQLPL